MKFLHESMLVEGQNNTQNNNNKEVYMRTESHTRVTVRLSNKCIGAEV